MKNFKNIEGGNFYVVFSTKWIDKQFGENAKIRDIGQN